MAVGWRKHWSGLQREISQASTDLDAPFSGMVANRNSEMAPKQEMPFYSSEGQFFLQKFI
jgi:hypothetical protein